MSLEFLDDTENDNEISELEESEETLGSVEFLGDGVLLEKINGFFENVKNVFEGKEANEGIIGNPEKDMEVWHVQESPVSCAVCCQEFVAEQATGQEFTEQEFCDFAENQGWFDPETGTAPDDVGNILEYMGFDVTQQEGVTIQELSQMLENGEKVIVGVNNMVLAYPELAELPGYNANHAVQVIGIDTTDPNNIEVILNDPGVENGKGIRHSMDDFVKAWNTGNNFTVSATKE